MRSALDTRQRLDLAGSRLWHRGRDVRENHRDLPTEQVGDGLRVALVGHVQQIHAGQRLQHLTGDPRGARAAAEGDLARVGLGVVDQFLRRGYGYRGIDHQGQRDRPELADGREIGDRIVGQLLVEALIGRMRRVGRDQHGVPVGLGAGHVLGGEKAARARHVVDDDGLPEARRHLLAQHARQRVGGAARRERHDELDRPIRIGILCVRLGPA